MAFRLVFTTACEELPPHRFDASSINEMIILHNDLTQLVWLEDWKLDVSVLIFVQVAVLMWCSLTNRQPQQPELMIG